MIRSVGYDAKSQTLEIEFKTGKIYQYAEVSPSVHKALMAADSCGGYFNAMIKDAFPTVRR